MVAVAATADLTAAEHRGQALVPRSRRDVAGALAHLEAALTAQPDHLGNPLDVANTPRELRQFDEARQIYRRILELKPDHPGALVGLGVVARQRGQHEAARGLLEAAVKGDPAKVAFHSELALTLRELDRFDEAEAVYNQILSHFPSHPHALIGKGRLARQLGNRDAALNCFEAASQADPANVSVSMTLVDELRDQGQFERARLILETVLKNDPENPLSWIHLGLLERGLGQREKALTAFETAHGYDALRGQPLVQVATEQRVLGRRIAPRNICAVR
jgi:tetratricopeptide (TPR) repeat protein